MDSNSSVLSSIFPCQLALKKGFCFNFAAHTYDLSSGHTDSTSESDDGFHPLMLCVFLSYDPHESYDLFLIHIIHKLSSFLFQFRTRFHPLFWWLSILLWWQYTDMLYHVEGFFIHLDATFIAQWHFLARNCQLVATCYKVVDSNSKLIP